jgi:hypothetical protein
MNRTEIEEKIRAIIEEYDDFMIMPEDVELISKKYLNLFIELSNERCEEQREICSDVYLKSDNKGLKWFQIEVDILNSPSPQIEHIMNKTEINKMVEKSAEELNQEFINKWVLLSLYLEQEVSEGKREFRIAFQDDEKFIVHPLGKDGLTLDLQL